MVLVQLGVFIGVAGGAVTGLGYITSFIPVTHPIGAMMKYGIIGALTGMTAGEVTFPSVVYNRNGTPPSTIFGWIGLGLGAYIGLMTSLPR